MKEEYKKVQDNDSHWYWIPTNLLEEFEQWNNMDTETDEFIRLIDKFEDYRTYGHPDETPAYWLLKEETTPQKKRSEEIIKKESSN